MTRGLRCLLHGDLASAVLFNPLGMVVLVGLSAYLFYAVIVVTARLPRIRWEPLTDAAAWRVRLSVILLILGNWFYLIYHERFITALR